MTSKIHEFPVSEDSVQGTLNWAIEQHFDAVAIIGWGAGGKIYFGYSRLNNLIEKIGILEYCKIRLGLDLKEED